MEALEAGLSKLMDQLFGREGLLSPSIGDVIRDHVFATLDRFISERSWASDRDTTVAILPNGPILPLESEVIIEELPSYVWRFPPDPFHPSSPVGLWITSLLGKLVGVCIAVCVHRARDNSLRGHCESAGGRRAACHASGCWLVPIQLA